MSGVDICRQCVPEFIILCFYWLIFGNIHSENKWENDRALIGRKWILRCLLCLGASWIKHQQEMVGSVLSEDHCVIFFLDDPDQTSQSLGLIFFVKIRELYELSSKVLFFQMLLVDFRETLDFLVSG